jgi:hypothetical protein
MAESRDRIPSSKLLARCLAAQTERLSRILPKENVPAFARWASKSPNAVFQLYRQFSSETDMKVYIAKTHHLKVQPDN